MRQKGCSPGFAFHRTLPSSSSYASSSKSTPSYTSAFSFQPDSWHAPHSGHAAESGGTSALHTGQTGGEGFCGLRIASFVGADKCRIHPVPGAERGTERIIRLVAEAVVQMPHPALGVLEALRLLPERA